MHDAGEDPGLAAPGHRIFQRRCDSSFDAVRAVLLDLAGALEQCGFTQNDIASAELVLAEAMNNIVEHAYGERPGGTIRLGLSCSPRGLLVTLEDQGREMPGCTLPAGRANRACTNLADLPEGGFGWFLIRDIAHDLTYCRANGTNRVCFRIAVGDADTTA